MTWMETTAAPRSRSALQGALRALWSARSLRMTLHALLGLPVGVAGGVVIVGLDRPDAGTAIVNGKPYRIHAAPLRQVGALLEARSVHKARTARERTLAA